MKVIDLLNKIANGEEVPKKIRFDNTYWNRICGEKNMYYKNDYDDSLFVYFFRKDLTFTLNDEVEIIEDVPLKKLENLNMTGIDINKKGQVYGVTKEEMISDIKTLQNWVNKIIDKLNSMEE